MKYIIKYLFISLLLICGITAYLLCYTREGLILELSFLSRHVPGNIKIEKVSGTLFSGFTLENTSYDYANQHVAIQLITVQWYPSQLLHGKLAFDTLTVKEATIQLSGTPEATENTTSFNPRWLQSVSFKQFNLEHIILQKSDQSIAFDGKLTDHWDVTWKFNLPKLKAFTPTASGALQGNGTITGNRLTPAIHATLIGNQLAYAEQRIASIRAETHIILQPNKPTSLKLTATGMKLYDYKINEITINANGTVQHHKNTLLTTFQVNTNKQFKMNGAFTLPQFKRINDFTQPITGSFQFSTQNLNLLPQLISYIKDPRGELNGNIQINGILKKPVFRADLTLNKGAFSLPVIGIKPDNITAQGQFDNRLNLTFKGSLRSGTGIADLQGNCDFSQPEMPLKLTVRGNNLQLIHLSEYQVDASTQNLSVLFTYPSLQLQGNLIIPRAKIAPKQFKNSVTLPDEVVFVNKRKSLIQTSSPIVLSLQLGLELGDDVYVDYDNLTAKLLGKLTITQIPGSLAQGSGEFYTARGQYAAYGQKLTIESARLIYTGNTLMNPGLSIRAIKQMRRVVTQNGSSFTNNSTLQNIPIDTETLSVGVQVTGTADNPRISLFSVPADLSQGDILSYLLIGLPQSQASGAQGTALVTALSAYNPEASKVFGIPNKLEETFGLNELDVESIETFNPNTQSVESTTSFVVGKQISKKISIHYSIGLFNPISVFNVRYQISQHWAAQSETSTLDSGADLLFGFERD